MGGVINATTFRKAQTPAELIGRFAIIMRRRYGASLYLFGSRARRDDEPGSDFDIVAVSEQFRGQRRPARALDRFYLWLQAGGWGQGSDLHCYTPEEFQRQIKDGEGYLGEAWRKGQLISASTILDQTSQL